MGPLRTFKFYNDVFFKSIAERHLTYAGFVPFLIGLLIPRGSAGGRLFDWWLVAMLIYFGIVTVGNQVHEYYQLPFVIPAVVYVGKTFDRYLSWSALRGWRSKPWRVALLVACLAGLPTLSALRLVSLMRRERLQTPPFELAAAVAERTARGDLVVAVDRGDPFLLYCCGRKGWHSSPEGLTPDFLAEKEAQGARFVVGCKESAPDSEVQPELKELLRRHPVVVETQAYYVVRLSARAGGS